MNLRFLDFPHYLERKKTPSSLYRKTPVPCVATVAIPYLHEFLKEKVHFRDKSGAPPGAVAVAML